MLTKYVTTGLSILTIAGDIIIVLFILDWLFGLYSKKKELTLFPMIWKKIKEKTGEYALLVASIATLGSLYYSEVAGYNPCKLCWYQRIFMYPQVLMFLIHTKIRDKTIYLYSLVLSAFGGLIAAYHYYIQVFPEHTPEGCSVVGYASSCSDNFLLHFGYISIPMMALTAFLLLVIFSLLKLDWVKTK